MTGPKHASPLARAKHPTGTCYASFSKMSCQYTSVLPVAILPQPRPSSPLNTHGPHEPCLLGELMQQGVGWVFSTGVDR